MFAGLMSNESISFENRIKADLSVTSETITKAVTSNQSNCDCEVIAPDLENNNYPNPFNPVTNIFFYNPESGRVKVDIFDIKGRRVRKLADNDLEAGKQRLMWNGMNENGVEVASGMYFYRVETPAGSETKKMIMMK
jgi:flagellar hook assembly protein FlgD